MPPGEYNDIQRRGFREGIEGARKDRENGRQPDPGNRDEFRHPHDMPREMVDAYRDAFTRGYSLGVSRFYGGAAAAPMPPGGAGDEWAMRGLASDAARQGFHDGRDAARRDFESHRPADPDDHEEYRAPNVSPDRAENYRIGFMRGYESSMAQLNGEPNWQSYGEPAQWHAPDRFSDMQRRGFAEGMEGAQKDFQNHRQPNPANRDEYRRPHVPAEFWPQYREGFRRGYEAMSSRIYGAM